MLYAPLVNEAIVQVVIAALAIASGTLIARRGWWRVDAATGASPRTDPVLRLRPLAFLTGVLIIFSAQGLGAAIPMMLGFGPPSAANGAPAPKPGIDDLGRIALGAYGLGIAAAACVLVALAYLSNLTSSTSFTARDGGNAEPSAPMDAGLTLARGSWRKTVLQALGVLVLALPLCALVGVVMTHVARLTTGLPDDGLAHETLRVLREAWDGAASASGAAASGAADSGGTSAAGSMRTFTELWPIAAVAFGALIGAPIVEEVLFRVCVQSGILAFTRSRWAAILLTSVVFVALHSGGSSASWHALPTLFVLSVALGVAYERTRRVGVVILAHAGFNAVNVALAMLAA